MYSAYSWWARRSLLGIIGSVALAACQSESKPKPTAAEEVTASVQPWHSRTTKGAGFPCDVEQVLSNSCRRCHWNPQENDAPFALDSWEAVQRTEQGKPVYRLMLGQLEAKLMPPIDLPVTPKVTPLSEQQRTVLLAWLKQGAPRSEAVCE